MNTSKLEKIISDARFESMGTDIAALQIKMLIADVAGDILHEMEDNSLSTFVERLLERVRAL